MAELPPPNTKRWVIRRKAAVVAAVRAGEITVEEACRRYQLSEEEFFAWQRAFEAGLARCTRRGGGFEPSVPRKTVAVVDTARCPLRHLSMLWRSEPDLLQNRFGALCMRSRSPLFLSREPENSRDRGQTAW